MYRKSTYDANGNWHGGLITIYDHHKGTTRLYDIPSRCNGQLYTQCSEYAYDMSLANTDGIAGDEIYTSAVWGYTGSATTQTISKTITDRDSNYKTLGAIDSPGDKQTITGIYNISGWALDDTGVAKVEVFLDGTKLGNATLGVQREDVYRAYPQYLNHYAGFTYTLDTTKLTGGAHTLTLRETGTNGLQFEGSRSFGIDNDPPSVPGNLRLASHKDNTATLTWNASTDYNGVTGYILYNDGVQVAETSNTSYTFTGLAPGTTYQMNVRAKDAFGHISGKSNTFIYATMDWKIADLNGDGKADLFKFWGDNGQFTADAHLSSGSAFGITRFATQQGGLWNSMKWFTGDFNGDGKQDLMKLWNDGGKMTSDVHLSNGSSFTIQRWATQQGGYWDSQQWVVGDFNGDGKTDLAKGWSDNGKFTADVHISDGTKFTMQRWATQQGGIW